MTQIVIDRERIDRALRYQCRAEEDANDDARLAAVHRGVAEVLASTPYSLGLANSLLDLTGRWDIEGFAGVDAQGAVLATHLAHVSATVHRRARVLTLAPDPRTPGALQLLGGLRRDGAPPARLCLVVPVLASAVAFARLMRAVSALNHPVAGVLAVVYTGHAEISRQIETALGLHAATVGYCARLEDVMSPAAQRQEGQ